MKTRNIYTLADDVIVRKEWFGCMICNTRTGDFFQFNEDAFLILKNLSVPRSIQEIQVHLTCEEVEIGSEELTEFLKEMGDLGIVAGIAQQTSARVLFADHTKFRDDCLVAPSSATIYLTEWCSKECAHCVVRSSPFVDRTGELSVDQWKAALKRLYDFGVCAVVFTGGEPLMKEGVFEILKEADRLGFSISLLTDYDGLKDVHLEQLKQLRHLTYIQTSVDGGKAETHDSIRGRGAFKHLLNRLALLQKHEIRFTVSSTIGRYNLNELDQIVELVQEYGASYLYINPLAPYGRAKEELASTILEDKELQWLGQKYYCLTSTGVINTGNPFWHQPVEDLAHFHPFKEALTAVSLGVYNISFNSRGDCYLDSKMKSEDLLCLGNILVDNIEDMWLDSRLDHLRAFYSADRFTFIDQSEVIE